MQLICNQEKDLPYIAKEIIQLLGDKNIVLFDGEMGAGKTTTIKALCSVLGVQSHVSSPTYSIVNEYINKGNNTIYHFDFYRLKNEMEAWEIGIEEYFESGNLCLIEWGEKIPNLLPSTFLKVKITLDQERRLFQLTSQS